MTPVCIFFRRKYMERSYDVQLTYESPITRDVLNDTRSIASGTVMPFFRDVNSFHPIEDHEVIDKVRRAFFLCVAEVSATHYNSTPYGVGVVVVVVYIKLKNGITFERLEIST